MGSSEEKTAGVKLIDAMSTTDSAAPDIEPFFPFDSIVTAAFDGKFKESAAGTLKLPEHDPAIFRFFAYWLYTGKLDGNHYPSTEKPSITEIRRDTDLEWQNWHEKYLPHYTAKGGGQLTNEEGQLYRLLTYRDAPFDALIGLYLLAEYLGVPGLGDEITYILVDVYANANSKMEGVLTSFWRWKNCTRPRWAPDPVPCINAAWKMSSEDSHLCRLLVVLFCDNVIWNADDVQKNERLDAGFLSAAYTMAQDRWVSGAKKTQWQTADALCAYHNHDGTTCRFNENEKLAKAKK
ncbi:MAG: hypothetical protein Q9213_000675 [Squamulea squamosa]